MRSGSGDKLPLVRRRLSMRAMTGSRLAGLLSTAAVLLLPALGVGTASALDVGEVVPLLVPDVSEFPDAPVTKDFICVAITDNAYWLVQDSTYLGSNPDAPDTSAVWGNFITQVEIDSLTAQFEGDGIDVYGTVTTLLGAVPDSDADPQDLDRHGRLPRLLPELERTVDPCRPHRPYRTRGLRRHRHLQRPRHRLHQRRRLQDEPGRGLQAPLLVHPLRPRNAR